MSDVIVFRPKAELDASDNLKGFVDSCRRELTIFGANLSFDENVWDITEYIELKGHGGKRHRLVFSNLTTVKDSAPTPMSEPFLSFAKAYYRYMQGMRPVVGIGPRLSALRALEAALVENGGDADPVQLDLRVFNRAGQLIVEKFEAATAYRVGGQLEMLAEFLADNKLTSTPARWKNFIKRPSDTVRVGKEFDERRNDKMPSQAALDALPEIFHKAVEAADVMATSIAAILCASPDRISELLSLPVDCEVHQKNPKTGEIAYGLRWWPAKGANPMVKWIVPSMVGVVQEAIEKIRKITNESRIIARWYDDHPNQLYLSADNEYLREKKWLTMKELGRVFGFIERTAALNWCNRNKVKSVKRLDKKYVLFADIEKVILGTLPSGFPIMDETTGCKYSEVLFVVRVNELGAKRAVFECMIEPITINQINTMLGGRIEHGHASIFSKHGYVEPDGSNINVSTHQFRHYLNTLAQAGGLSQLDIAKWSGRKDIKQNAAYDHVTPGQMVQKIREAIGDESVMFGPLAELSKKVLIPRDEFARLVVPTAHTTDIGYCIRDYTMSPCQTHMDCINCRDLVCIKGDTAKEQRLRMLLDEENMLLQQTEQASKEQYHGSDRWLDHHKPTVERLSELLSIMDNPAVPIGAVIQLSPPKSSTDKITVQKKLNNSVKVITSSTIVLEQEMSTEE